MSLHRQLFIAILLVFVLGLIMIFNTSSAEALDLAQPNTHQALFKQLMYGGIGCLAATALFHIGYKRLISYSPFILAAFTLLLACVFLPGIGIMANGSHRWVGIGGWSVQPSEFVKYIAPIYFIHLLMHLQQPYSLQQFFRRVWPLGIPALLIFLEPNNGTVGVLGCVLTVVCFLLNVPLRFWALPLACVVVLGALLALKMPYVASRIQVYLHPEMDLKGKGHQPYQAKIASGSGGLFGKGPGKSVQKLSYLPEAQNDYIAAIFAEEYGFVGILSLIALYTWIGIIGFGIAMYAPVEEARYVAAVIAFLITFQAFLNLGVVSGLLPSTGLNLPFFSQGGSSLMAHLAASGVLMNIATEKQVVCNV